MSQVSSDHPQESGNTTAAQIGATTVDELLEAGHKAVGLPRSDTSAESHVGPLREINEEDQHKV